MIIQGWQLKFGLKCWDQLFLLPFNFKTDDKEIGRDSGEDVQSGDGNERFPPKTGDSSEIENQIRSD